MCCVCLMQLRDIYAGDRQLCPPMRDACLCALQHKVHRIPVVDYNTQVVGIVTRTDIFTALALNEGSPELLTT